jgi:hypothetical protein
MKTQLLLAAALAGLLAGCAEKSLVLGKGHGLATGCLYRSAETKVLAADAAAHPETSDREVLDTAVVTPPIVTATPYDTAYTHTLPDPNKGDSGSFPVRRDAEPVYSKFVERWTVRHGADRSRYLVTFQPGPHNDAKIDVAADQ